MSEHYTKIAQLKSVTAFRNHLAELGLDLPIDDEIISADDGSPLAQPLTLGSLTCGNRWCIHPMEGRPLRLRRWRWEKADSTAEAPKPIKKTGQKAISVTITTPMVAATEPR